MPDDEFIASKNFFRHVFVCIPPRNPGHATHPRHRAHCEKRAFMRCCHHKIIPNEYPAGNGSWSAGERRRLIGGNPPSIDRPLWGDT
jgi:hypothetical protein